MIKKFNLFFLTFFMIGKIKYAPGTIASLITCLLFLLLINIFNIEIIFLITLIIFFYSFHAINNSFNEFKSEDPQEIVIDEFVGQMWERRRVANTVERTSRKQILTRQLHRSQKMLKHIDESVRTQTFDFQ